MNALRRLAGGVLIGLLLWASTVCAQQSLTLLGRSSVEGLSVRFSQTESRWLQQKGRLVLAVSAPDYPPFEFNTAGKVFEGVTADYAGLLEQLLNVVIEIGRAHV